MITGMLTNQGPRARRGGFTLLELVVVIALIGVVTTLATQLFVKMGETWRGVQIRTELDQQAQFALDQIRQDCAAMLSPALSGVYPRGEERFAPGQQTFEDDTLTIPTLMPGTGTGELTAGLAQYLVDRERGNTLVRRAGPLGAEPSQDSETAVVAGVVRLKIEFWDKAAASWRAGWSGERAPNGLRVSIVLEDPDFPFEQVARYAVIPIFVS